VLTARSLIADARQKTFEALACLARPTCDVEDLPPRFLLHFRTLFRLDGGAVAFLRMLKRVAAALQVLDNEICTPKLQFIEYGTDTVTNIMNALASVIATPIYQPSDVAMVRGFSVARASNYIGLDHVEGCLNTGHGTGNPNEIMIKLSSLDKPLEHVTDTVIHESTHKFLGTEDEGMTAASFSWMADDGLALYLRDSPGVPLPMHTPGFLAKTPDQALANAYILAAYIQYMPEGEVAVRTELNRSARLGALGSDTALGQTLRAHLARLRPPEDE